MNAIQKIVNMNAESKNRKMNADISENITERGYLGNYQARISNLKKL